MSLTNEQSFENLFTKELKLLCQLKGPQYFTAHDSLDRGVLFKSSPHIPTSSLDVHDGFGICALKIYLTQSIFACGKRGNGDGIRNKNKLYNFGELNGIFRRTPSRLKHTRMRSYTHYESGKGSRVCNRCPYIYSVNSIRSCSFKINITCMYISVK